jgi:hypothetical protein
MREWVTSDDQSLLVLENPFLLRAVEYLNYKGLAASWNGYSQYFKE